MGEVWRAADTNLSERRCDRLDEKGYGGIIARDRPRRSVHLN